jgi:hypothetical protein
MLLREKNNFLFCSGPGRHDVMTYITHEKPCNFSLSNIFPSNESKCFSLQGFFFSRRARFLSRQLQKDKILNLPWHAAPVDNRRPVDAVPFPLSLRCVRELQKKGLEEKKSSRQWKSFSDVKVLKTPEICWENKISL